MRLALALLLLAALASFAPPASAQVGGPALQLRVDSPQAPAPAGASVDIALAVTVSCQAMASASDPTAPQNGAVVTIAFDLVAGVTVTGPGQVHVPPQGCATGGLTASVTQAYTIALSRTVPGLKPLSLVARAHLGGGMGADAAAPFTVTADYESRTEVKVDSRLHSCTCGLLRFDVDLSNLGNARTQYTFEPTEQPREPGWTLEVPPVLLLDSPNDAGGDGAGHITFLVHMGDAVTGQGVYSVRITPSAADDPAKHGEPLTVNFLARNQRVIPLTSIPGIEAPLLLLGLVAVAFVARRDG